jgi:(p)ppGpp synthase/HD superfamily hydrolase
MKKDFEIKFKKALDFLRDSDISSPNKPAIPHDVRVGQYLYEKGFEDEVVEAGILHDMLEWSSVSEEEIEREFGKRVLDIVKANSKDRRIEGTENRARDMVDRCRKLGDDAVAIKISDTFDSFNYYLSLRKEKEVERSRIHARFLSEGLSDKLRRVFEEDLQKILKN